MTWTQDRFPVLLEPTVLDAWTGTKLCDGKEVELTIFDTPGHEDLATLARPIAYYNADCFLVCYAINDRNSFNNACSNYLNEIKAIAKNAPCILVGTKTDLRTDASEMGDNNE